MSGKTGPAYAGDISAADTWRELEQNKDAVLVDVRTRAEWAYVGVPRLDDLGREAILAEWQSFPSMDRVSDFAGRLSAELTARGVSQDTPIFFLCRSGARSRSAAVAMTAAGYSRCFNIADGFEGPLDAEGHRGAVAGWKANGLPWGQS